MRRSVFFIFYVLLIINICLACGKKQPERVYFTIDPVDRKIVLPVQVSDSITANLVFDTGAYLGALYFDSTFCDHHTGILEGAHFETTLNGGSAWSDMRVSTSHYKNSPAVKIGNRDLNYTHMRIENWRWYFATDSDGMFNIPENDSIHVWELNFENNYLEIHTANNFKMPEDCFVVTVEQHPYHLYIRLPLKIRFADGDTLALDRLYLVDTGMPWDIALMSRAKELDFLNQRKDAIWTGSSTNGGYHRYHTADAVLSGDFPLDSLRLYTFDHPNYVRCDYLIGQNFLKRFNVFFNMKDRIIGLQPIKNFQRIVDPIAKRFHFSMEQTNDNKNIVSLIADYEGNYYKTAGLQVKDEITAINGINPSEMTFELKENIYQRDTVILDILRSGKPLKIIVPVDKNEVQGD